MWTPPPDIDDLAPRPKVHRDYARHEGHHAMRRRLFATFCASLGVKPSELNLEKCWTWPSPIFALSFYGQRPGDNKPTTLVSHPAVVLRNFLEGKQPPGRPHHHCNNPACVNPLHYYPTTGRAGGTSSASLAGRKKLLEIHPPS